MVNSRSPLKRWHTVGQGAISSFCTVNLGENVTVIGRAQTVVKNDKKQFVHLDGSECDLPLPTPLSQIDKIENLLIAVKAYDVEAAIRGLKDKLCSGANIVLCHNGMGTIDVAVDLLDQLDVNLYFCTTSSGAHIEANKVKLVAVGQSFWQSIRVTSPNSQLHNDDFNRLFKQAEQAPNLKQILWTKLAINCVINPLTAIFQVSNGQLQEAIYEDTVSAIIEEFLSIANTQNVSFEFAELKRNIYQVMASTGKNRSSMLQDVTNNKPTEIDFINGYIVKLAQQYKLPVPVNESMVAKVKTKSNQSEYGLQQGL